MSPESVPTKRETHLRAVPEIGDGLQDKHPLGSVGAGFDKLVDQAWDPLRSNANLNQLFYTASELADFSLLWHIAGATRGIVRRKGHREAIRLSAALGAESALINGGIKSIFSRDRPTHNTNRPHNLRKPITSSFPSGHSSAAFLAATLLSERSKIKPFWYATAAIVAVSRIHVRMHHASDVVVGAGIGLGLGRLIKKVLPLR